MTRRALLSVTAILLWFLPTGWIHAQVLQGYTLRAGANSSKLTATFYGMNRQTGFQLAIAREFLESERLSLQLELEYSLRGYGAELVERDSLGHIVGPREAVTYLHFISLPILARIRVPGSHVVLPYLLLGPRVDWLVASNPGEFKFTQGATTDALPDVFRKLSLSLVVGLGTQLRLKPTTSVRLDIRRNLGLSDLMPTRNSFTMKTWGVDVSVSISF
ncbi:porin family protein [Gemmatimonadota bacterium]